MKPESNVGQEEDRGFNSSTRAGCGLSSFLKSVH